MIKKINRNSFYRILTFIIIVFVLTLTVSDNKLMLSGLTLEFKGNTSKMPENAKKRDSVVIGAPSLEGEFNPLIAYTKADLIVVGNIFEPLISFDDEGRPQCVLAERYKVSSDGLIYSFKLRKDVKFSNGDILTARDVFMTYTAICDISLAGNIISKELSGLEGYDDYRNGDSDVIAGIEIIDDLNISFKFNEISNSHINAFRAGIMSEGSILIDNDITVRDKAHIESRAPIGTGAYKLHSYADGMQAVLTRNNNYHGVQGKAEEIIIKNMNQKDVKNEFESGDVDIYLLTGKQDIFEMTKSLEYVNLYSYESNIGKRIIINCENEILRDYQVRQAMQYAFNRTSIIQDLYNDTAYVNYSPYIKSSYVSKQNFNKYNYNIKKANSLLKEVNGEKLIFSLLINEFDKDYAVNREIAEIFSEDMRKIGIEININIVDNSIFKNDIERLKSFDLYFTEYSNDFYQDPEKRFSEDNKLWNDENIKILLNDLKSLTDIEKYEQICKEITYLYNKDCPYIFVLEQKQFVLCSSKIDRFEVNSYIKIY